MSFKQSFNVVVFLQIFAVGLVVALPSCNKCYPNPPPPCHSCKQPSLKPNCPSDDGSSPPSGCTYKWYTDDNGCPKKRHICECKKPTCSPTACRPGQICVPESRQCFTCPCPQYRCVSDPCAPYVNPYQPACSKCKIVQKPCGHKPCPLVAYRENYCYKPTVAPPCKTCPPVCPNYYNHCFVNPCSTAQCPAYPQATCYVDKCDCRKHYFVYNAQILYEHDCQVVNFAVPAALDPSDAAADPSDVAPPQPLPNLYPFYYPQPAPVNFDASGKK